MENNWYNTNEPFNLEVEITDESKRKDIEDLIIRGAFYGRELVPGLRINKAYKQSLDRQDILSSEMKDEFEHLMENTRNAFESFFNKWDKDAHPELKGVNTNAKDYPSYLDYPLK